MTPKEIILHARLRSSGADAIAGLLRERAAEKLDICDDEQVEEELETFLLQRSNRLVDLALAEHCLCYRTGQRLFFRNPPDLAIRLAVLSNQVVNWDLPAVLFEHDEIGWTEYHDYPGTASDDEIRALFSNPKIDRQFVADLLRGRGEWRGVWDSLRDERQRLVVDEIVSNRSLLQETSSERIEQSSFYCGFAHDVTFAAYHLAGTVPVTLQWAASLSRLYRGLTRDAYIPDYEGEYQDWLTRWTSDDDREPAWNSYDLLSPFQNIRKALTEVRLRQKPDLTEQFSKHPDLAVRCA